MSDRKLPEYYDNSKGSLYLFGEQQKLNHWEFDILKRIVRCRKKGHWKEDLEKTKALIDLYMEEYEKKETIDDIISIRDIQDIATKVALKEKTGI